MNRQKGASIWRRRAGKALYHWHSADAAITGLVLGTASRATPTKALTFVIILQLQRELEAQALQGLTTSSDGRTQQS